MNRRSFFALLPALPFVLAGAQSNPLHCRRRVLPRETAEKLRKLAESFPIGPKIKMVVIPFVGWKMTPEVGFEAFRNAMAIDSGEAAAKAMYQHIQQIRTVKI